jgi:TetR/AcrR family transcriptional regulator, transcriptional repressor of bet genes
MWRVMARDGPSRATMRAIAREAGYTTGMISHYFRDKRELIEYGSTLLLDRSLARITAEARDDPVAALAELLPLDDRRRDQARLWLTMMGWSGTDPVLAGQLARAHQQVRRHLRLVVGRQFPAIAEDEDAIRDVTDQVLAVIDGLTIGGLTNPDDYPPDRQLAVLRATLTTLSNHLAHP